MLFCSFLTYTVMKSFQGSFVLTHSHATYFATLKPLSLYVTFAIGLIFVLISRGQNMARAFNVFFPVNLLLLIVTTFFIRFEPTYFNHPWLLGATYCYFSIAAFFPVIFTWGFANQNYSFKTAALHYPFLIILLSPAIVLSPKLLLLHTPEFTTLVLFFLSLITYLIYLSLTKLDLGPKDEGNEISRGYYGALAALIFFITIGKYLIGLLIRVEMKTLYPSIKAYQSAMQNSSQLLGITQLFGLILGIILGIILFRVGKKAFGLINTLLLLAITTSGIFVFNTPAFHSLTKEHFALSKIAWALFLPLLPLLMLLGKELAFLGIPLEKRFTAKLAMDILMFTCASEISRYIPMILQEYHDANILNHSWVYLGIFILCMIAVFKAIISLHRGLSQRTFQ